MCITVWHFVDNLPSDEFGFLGNEPQFPHPVVLGDAEAVRRPVITIGQNVDNQSAYEFGSPAKQKLGLKTEDWNVLYDSFR